MSTEWPPVVWIRRERYSDVVGPRVVPAGSPHAQRYVPETALEHYADELEKQNLEGDGPMDLTAATVRAVKAQGIRDALAALQERGG